MVQGSYARHITTLLLIIYLLILIPALDLDLVYAHSAECTDEGSCETRVGDEWNIEVNGCSADVISIGQLSV